MRSCPGCCSPKIALRCDRGQRLTHASGDQRHYQRYGSGFQPFAGMDGLYRAVGPGWYGARRWRFVFADGLSALDREKS